METDTESRSYIRLSETLFQSLYVKQMLSLRNKRYRGSPELPQYLLGIEEQEPALYLKMVYQGSRPVKQ